LPHITSSFPYTTLFRSGPSAKVPDGRKVNCVASGDQATVPVSQGPPEPRTPNAFAAPVVDSFIASDQFTWISVFRSTLTASERGEDAAMVGGVESTSNGAESTWAGAPRESSTSRCRTVSVALNPVGVQETTFESPPGVELRIGWLARPP